MSLTLYTTLGCHLCEELEAWFSRLGPHAPALHRVEIADEAELLARYGERIPVLRDAAGDELERGFEPARLAAWLEARGWLDEDAWQRAQQGDAPAEPEAKGAVMRGGRRYLGGLGGSGVGE
ncbi:glutaredoxin family protein [Halomonas sp. YLGW01]|uniref:glutaredoxin family protein n=1 Tax=Halomonas sp. YLGW01 TaxID=2773308 RepID=UPI0017852BFB|nr:glutaredoxin family protein [Halomonas sp. YLGW01]